MKLQGPKGFTGNMSVGGVQLTSSDGTVDVPDALGLDLIALHGFTPVGIANIKTAAAATEAKASGALSAIIDPVEHLFANLAKVTEAGVARIRAEFAPAPSSADPVEAFLSHLGELSVADIEKVIGAVIPKVQELMTVKAPPAAPQPIAPVAPQAAGPAAAAAPAAPTQ